MAGLDEETGEHIRPVLLGRLGEYWVSRYGGPFDIGEVVELGAVFAAKTPPHMEDHRFIESEIETVGTIAPDLFWKVLNKRCTQSFEEIFGPDLLQRGETAIIEEGKGFASLGIVQPSVRPSLWIRTTGFGSQQLRLTLNDGEFNWNLPVTDLRFYDEHDQIQMKVVASVNERLTRGVQSILSVGLTRAWSPSESQPPVHWLQCNNIHLADQPLWRLVDESLSDRWYTIPTRKVTP